MADAERLTEEKGNQSTSEEISQIAETGKIRYTMRNDYLFKAVLQENEAALRELVAALLHIRPTQIRSCEIENPIILGEALDEKTVILDILLTLNDDHIVDLEMQVVAQRYWKERSIVYLCRSFGELNKGGEYSQVKSAVHIGILDFDLFPGEKRLYSENILMDKITNRQYSDKLSLNVLSLKHVEDATDEERASGVYDWAKFFSAGTWEELKMAAKSEAMKSAVVTMRKLTADERIRRQCQAREDYDRQERTWQAQIQRAEAEKQEAEMKAQRAETQTQKLLDYLRKRFAVSEDELYKMMNETK